MGGPAIPFAYGRVDEMDPGKVTPDGRLPDADKGDGPGPKTRAGIREVFNRMGFDDQEIVALSGAHALGRCHADASGYVGPWSGTPTLFNNSYFVLLKGLKWTPNDKAAKFQARSIAHWSPYDRVGVVHAVSLGLFLPASLSAHLPVSIPAHRDAFQIQLTHPSTPPRRRLVWAMTLSTPIRPGI